MGTVISPAIRHHPFQPNHHAVEVGADMDPGLGEDLFPLVTQDLEVDHRGMITHRVMQIGIPTPQANSAQVSGFPPSTGHPIYTRFTAMGPPPTQAKSEARFLDIADHRSRDIHRSVSICTHRHVGGLVDARQEEQRDTYCNGTGHADRETGAPRW